MKQQDLEIVAAILASLDERKLTLEGKEYVIRTFTERLAQTNASFKRAVFLKSCHL